MSRIWLTVNDLKQYLYCPRVVYYYTVVPVDRQVTYKMKRGQLSQEELERLEVRRKLSKYGLTGGERKINLSLFSKELRLSGKLDCMIISSESEYIPVDFKDTLSRPHANHVIQLAAYGLLIESHYVTNVERGFIYAIPSKTIYPVEITAKLKDDVNNILQKIEKMIIIQDIPEKSGNQNKCQDCEFRNFCGDVF